jgi:hypothetical protein
LDEKWELALAGLGVDKVAVEVVVVDGEAVGLEAVWAAAVWGVGEVAAVPSAWEPRPIGAII